MIISSGAEAQVVGLDLFPAPADPDVNGSRFSLQGETRGPAKRHGEVAVVFIAVRTHPQPGHVSSLGRCAENAQRHGDSRRRRTVPCYRKPDRFPRSGADTEAVVAAGTLKPAGEARVSPFLKQTQRQ